MLIGSLPLDDHQLASRLIMDYSPAIPLWVQLPVFAQEKMVLQFLPGMPGVASRDGNVFTDTIAEAFDAELLSFYEDYMTVIETPDQLDDSRLP